MTPRTEDSPIQIVHQSGEPALDGNIGNRHEIQRHLEILGTALNNSNDAVFVINDALRFVFVNETACRSLGYSREELLTMGPTDIDPDITYEAARKLMTSIANNDLPPKFETRHRTKDGRIYPVEIGGAVFKYDGTVFGLSLVRDISERKRMEDVLRFVAQRGWQESGRSFFDALVNHLGQALDVEYVMIDKFGETPTRAETVALYVKGTIAPNISYDLAGTPCAHVMGQNYCSYTSGIQGLFPEDRLLVDMGAESYAGIPLWDSFGQPLGLIAILDSKPLLNELAVAQMLQIVAPRAAAELERARSDSRLRASERDFRSLTENAPDNIARYDLQGRFLYVNPPLAETLGIAARDAIGKTPRELIPSWDMTPIFTVIATGEPVEIEFTAPDAEGKLHYGHIRFVAERGPQGDIVGVMGIGRNVTERKRAERDLLILSSAINNASDEIFLINEQLRFIYVNDRACRSLGYSRDELLRMSPADIDAYIPRSELERMLANLLAQGPRLGRIETRHRTADGRVYPVEMSASVVEYENEHMALVVVRDITERKRAERDLLILGSAINNASDGILLVNEQLRFVYVNDRACRSLGRSRNDLMAMGPADVGIPHDVLARIQAHLLTDGPRLARAETQHRAADGRVFPIEVSASIVEHENENLGLVVARDISERKQAEAERLARMSFLQSLNRIDRAIQGANNLDTMMGNVLDAVLDIFNCDRAFLLYPCDPTATAWRVPMERTRPEHPGAFILGQEVPMDNEVAAKLRILLDSVGPIQFGKDIPPGLPADISTRFQFKRMMAMAVHPRVDKPWEFGIQDCSHARTWSAEEETLLHEIGKRLADGLTGLIAHRRVQESEAHLRTLVQTIPDLVWLKDPNGVFLHCNSRFERLFGHTMQEIVGKTDYDFVDRELADIFRENDRKALLAGKPSINEEWLTFAADGYRGLFETVKTPLLDETGKLIGVLSVARDITERNRMEYALRRREEEFRSLAEHLPDIVMRYDLECRRIYVNPAYLREVEIPVDEAINVAPDTRYWRSSNITLDQYKALLRQVMTSGKPTELMVDWKRGSDGVAAHYVMDMVAERDADGCVIGALCIGRNVYKLMESERRLKESRRQLRDLAARREDAREEERRHIARELHDELGQQLSALRFRLALLAYNFGEGQPQIREAVDSLLTLVGKTIQTTREVSSALRPPVLDMGIVPALEWLVSEYALHGGVSFELKGRLGDVAMNDACTVVVFRVVQESLTNAVRHSQADRIEVVFGREADAYVVEVRDNGVGFDPDAPRNPRSIGLIGIQERVLAVGGELMITSLPGSGTVLRTRIPVALNQQEVS
jgi:PAS domain S-box-containing protein